MLFNSPVFLFLFLPLVLYLYRVLGGFPGPVRVAWLCLASLVFYSYWNIAFLPILLLSMAANYGFGVLIIEAGRKGRPALATAAMTAGVALDLIALGYFKYVNFLLGIPAPLLGHPVALDVTLPLGISFFTFTQIAFLVDCWRGQAGTPDPLGFGLFVSYFPHLIAGPILHHAEMMPQFARLGGARVSAQNMAVGLTILIVGLFKKVVIADSAALYVGPVFDGPAGTLYGLADAWTAALAYTFQIYFDFSAYSDMAVGISTLFGIRLPINFNSPYKATSIIEFWRRWHMTLSRFLRDYLYIPLGGNRLGPRRRYINLMVTMLLGGLWHGAAWTFVLWGGLHGLYLAINHGWRAWRRGRDSIVPGPVAGAVGWCLTFLAVVLAWVLFRAPSLSAAAAVLRGMVGLNGVMPDHPIVAGRDAFTLLALLLIAATRLPNIYQFMGEAALVLNPPPAPQFGIGWRPSRGISVAVALLGAVSIIFLSRRSEFLYFQF